MEDTHHLKLILSQSSEVRVRLRQLCLCINEAVLVGAEIPDSLRDLVVQALLPLAGLLQLGFSTLSLFFAPSALLGHDLLQVFLLLSAVLLRIGNIFIAVFLGAYA